MLGRPRVAVRLERVLKLRDRGFSIRAIAEQTGVSAITVQRILAGQGAGVAIAATRDAAFGSVWSGGRHCGYRLRLLCS